MPEYSDPLLARLLASKNYRDICPDTVRRVWATCQQRYKKPKDVEKAAREALHGITGAFMTPGEARQLAYDMQAWHVDRTDLGLERMLSRHASTRERLPLAAMDELYGRVFTATGRPRSVLDLACGINPLYLGAKGIPAVGVDISGAAVEAVNRLGEVYGAPVSATCADILCPGSIPKGSFDVALLFKLLPLLERQEAGGASRVMKSVNARYLAVSFPTRSMGGRNVGMAAHYTAWMEEHMPPDCAPVERFETENELFYILKKQRSAPCPSCTSSPPPSAT